MVLRNSVRLDHRVDNLLIRRFYGLVGWVYDISTGKIEDLKVSEGTNVNGNPLE